MAVIWWQMDQHIWLFRLFLLDSTQTRSFPQQEPTPCAWAVHRRVEALSRAKREAALRGIFIILYYTNILSLQKVILALGWLRSWEKDPERSCAKMRVLQSDRADLQQDVQAVLPQAALSHACSQGGAARGWQTVMALPLVQIEYQ